MREEGGDLNGIVEGGVDGHPPRLVDEREVGGHLHDSPGPVCFARHLPPRPLLMTLPINVKGFENLHLNAKAGIWP